MSSAALGALAGGVACVVASPYLARLTRSVPDRDDHRWWTGRRAPARARLLLTAVTAVVLGALAGAGAGWSALLPAFLVLALFGTPLTIIDVERHRLPKRLTYPLMAGALVLLALAAAVRNDWPDYLRALEGGAAVSAALSVVYVVSPDKFGRGDVRLGGVLGLFLGWRSWLDVYTGIFAGFLVGSALALGWIALGRATMKTHLAFGPMLLLGALLVLAFRLTTAISSP